MKTPTPTPTESNTTARTSPPPLTANGSKVDAANSVIFDLENMASIAHGPPFTDKSKAFRRMNELWLLFQRKKADATP